jgi:hypothetical protein
MSRAPHAKTGSDDGLLTPEAVEMTLLGSRSRRERVTMAIPHHKSGGTKALAAGRARAGAATNTLTFLHEGSFIARCWPMAWLARPFEGLDDV